MVETKVFIQMSSGLIHIHSAYNSPGNIEVHYNVIAPLKTYWTDKWMWQQINRMIVAFVILVEAHGMPYVTDSRCCLFCNYSIIQCVVKKALVE